MRRILAAIALMAGCAQPALAQVSQAKFDSAMTRIAQLETIVGVAGFLAPQLPCPIPDSLRPPAWFPNGEYNIAFRNRQFGCAFDPLSTLAYGLQAQMTGALQRLAVVEGNGAHNPPPSTSNLVNGDLVVTGRICVPIACLNDAGEQIQIRAAKSAGMLMQANLDGADGQNTQAGCAIVSFAKDLGLRLIQNQRWTNDGGYIGHCVPEYPKAAVGYDSQGDWSFNSQAPGEADLGTQKLVLRTDRANKQVYWALWAEGWTLGVRSSTLGCKWCENVRWTIPAN